MARILSPKEILAKDNPVDAFISKSERWLDEPKDIKEIKERLEIIKELIYQYSFPVDVKELDHKTLTKVYRKLWNVMCILKDFVRTDVSHRLDWDSIEMLPKAKRDANYIRDYQKYINPDHSKTNIDMKV